MFTYRQGQIPVRCLILYASGFSLNLGILLLHSFDIAFSLELRNKTMGAMEM